MPGSVCDASLGTRERWHLDISRRSELGYFQYHSFSKESEIGQNPTSGYRRKSRPFACGFVVNSVEKLMGSLDRIAEVLIWSAHSSLVEFQCVEQIEVDGYDLSIPFRILMRPNLSVVPLQALNC